MFQKIKFAITEPENKWYLQTWFICICFATWFFIIPFFVAIALLIFHYINNYKRNLKYGTFNEIEEKIHNLD